MTRAATECAAMITLLLSNKIVAIVHCTNVQNKHKNIQIKTYEKLITILVPSKLYKVCMISVFAYAQQSVQL